MDAENSVIPQPGERGLIIGQTGSGKTAFALYMLERLKDVPIICYDTKGEDKFLTLAGSRVAYSENQVIDAIGDPETDYIIYRPPPEFLADPKLLDDLLTIHFNNYFNIPAYIDEVTQFYNSRNPGAGLLGLLSRGRSRGITTIMSTQRPVAIASACKTEAQKFYIFTLLSDKDKKSVGDIVPNYDKYANPVKHGFYFYKAGEENPILFPPITLPKIRDTGYVDQIENAITEAEPITEPNPARKINWL